LVIIFNKTNMKKNIYWLIQFEEEIEWKRPSDPKKSLMEQSKLYHSDSFSYYVPIKGMKILKKAKAEFFQDLDFSLTSTYKNLLKDSKDSTLKIGWLSPDGVMHYCKYQNHITYADMILDESVSNLEEKGWLHIIKDSDSKSGAMIGYYKYRITQKQARYLTLAEIEFYEDDVAYQ